MAFDSRSSPVAPLSVGNVVSVAFQLYRENAKQYLKIALAATGWLLLYVGLLVVFILVAVLMGWVTPQSFPTPGLLVLAAVAALVLMMFCLAKFLANSALISRLAFGQLSNRRMDELESRRFVNSRKWSFLLNQVLVGLISLSLFIGFCLIIAVLFSIGTMVMSRVFQGSNVNPLVLGGLGLLLIVLLPVAIATLMWFSARLLGAEVPLAVEPQISASQSISRFWQLTKGNVWRVVLVLLIGFAVTLPFFLLGQVLSGIPQLIVSNLPTQDSRAAESLVVLMSYAIGLALNLFILPFWQSIKGVLYYDLRNRREGLDLKLQNR